ncbi:SDR family oxidoreductase [Sphingomonas sp.]|uniref:SDR family NAD(P)-dependent oxidoreductase n=1 Tax=Sphingomonas sp. TaxID=28214 RepID=UPI001B19B782|nr:SDR family oxidoreductase [Sphingomonas sp.]MBO9714009.1 SDR family oxidoreductase [Sphingomonas sp.]
MSKKLAGKRAFVTGGSRGIGAAIVKRYAAEGADVVFTYAGNHEAAKATLAAIESEGVKGLAIQADAADPAAVEAAVAKAAETLGAIDILVHNAGVAGFAPVDQENFAEYRRIFGVNVDGVVAGTLAALPHIPDGGRIVLVGSVVGDVSPFGGLGSYAATKAALASFGRSWARDLGPRGILVNVIQPGPIATDMAPSEGELHELLESITVLNRFGKPEEVAALAAFLASDDASYITGAAIDVSGGASI